MGQKCHFSPRCSLVMVQSEGGWVLPKILVPRSQAAFCVTVGRGGLSLGLFPSVHYGDKEIIGC